MLRSRLIIFAGALPVVAALALMFLGVSSRDALLLTVAVAAQAWAGGYLWRLATARVDRPPTQVQDPLDLLGAALAVGTAASVLSGLTLQSLGLGAVGWLAMPLSALVLWVLRRARGQRLAPVSWTLRRSTWMGFSVALFAGLATIAINVSRYPLAGDGPWTTYHRDMLYFEGLATSTSAFGANDSIFMAGADVRYHWLAYGWAGQLTNTVAAEPFVVLTRVLPIVALIGCSALVIGWTARLVDRWPATVLAAALVTAGGYVGATNGTILNFDSPSQNLTTLWMLGALIVALRVLREDDRWSLAALFIILVAATAGGKISSAAVILVPVGLLAVVMSIRRDQRWRSAWLLLALGLVAVAGVYAALVSGSASPGDLRLLSLESRASSVQGLDSSIGPRGIVIGTATLMLAMAARWWGLAWLVGSRSSRWQPDTVVGVGLIVVGLSPVVLLSQGVNETWFALAASAPLAALSAAGIALGWSHVRSRPGLVVSLVLGAVVVVVVPLVWVPNVVYPSSLRFFGPWMAYGIAIAGGLLVGLALRGRQWFPLFAISAMSILVFAGAVSRVSPVVASIIHGPDAGSASSPSEAPPWGVEEGDLAPDAAAGTERFDARPGDKTTWGVAEANAGQYVRAHFGTDDVLVTNETTSFLVPALTQRRTYLSGSPYQALYGSEDSVIDIPDRIDVSLAFTRGLDDSAFAALCRAHVTGGWIALEKTPLRSWEPYADTLFENDSVAIVRINQDRCP